MKQIMYENLDITIACVVLICLFITMFAIYYFNHKNQIIAQRRKNEFNRFILHICRSNDAVYELNLINFKRYMYVLKDGELFFTEDSFEIDGGIAQSIFDEDQEKVRRLCSVDSLKRLVKK